LKSENVSAETAGIHAKIDTANVTSTIAVHVYEIRPRKVKRSVDLISDTLPFERLWSGRPDAISKAVGSVKFYSRPALLAFPL